MENPLLIGLSRQMVLERQMDVVANNVANVNTNGFKADNSLFEQYLMPLARENRFNPADRQVSFVNDRGTWRDMAPGAIEVTRTASATHATARCRSTPRASSSPLTADWCSATTARSPSSRPTTTSRSPRTAASP